MNQFLLNYFLRVVHIGSMIGLSHKTFHDYQAGMISSDNAFLYLILGIITIISGFLETFTLKPERMGKKKHLWVGYHTLKLFLTILLYLPIPNLVISGATLASLRMYWVLSIIVVAPFMKLYRQKFSQMKHIQK